MKKIRFNMFFVLLFLSVALSIVKANAWIVVPSFCVVICWILCVLFFFIYSIALSIANKFIEEESTKKFLSAIKENKE